MRNSFLVITLMLLMLSCRDKIICPAFQSTYLLDDSTRLAYYSYVWKLDKETRDQYLASAYGARDSSASGSEGTMRYYDYVADIIQPREQVRRNSYGIIRYEPMWLTNYKLKTAPKENIHGPVPEVIEVGPIDTGTFLASDFGDSLSLDSTAVVLADTVATRPETVRVALDTRNKKKEVKYLYRYDPDSLNNVEQEYYNKYYGQLLIDYSAQRRQQAEQLAIAKKGQEAAREEIDPADSTTGRGFRFKSMFKKDEQKSDTESSSSTGQETSGSKDEGGG